MRAGFNLPNVHDGLDGPRILASGRALGHLLTTRYNTMKRTPKQAKLAGDPIIPGIVSSMSSMNMKNGGVGVP